MTYYDVVVHLSEECKKKISLAMKAYCESLSEEERRARTANARAASNCRLRGGHWHLDGEGKRRWDFGE